MGYSIRTLAHRYTEHYRYHKNGQDFPAWMFVVQDDDPVAVQLFDHDQDPWESVNRARDKKYAPVLKELKVQLRQGWRN